MKKLVIVRHGESLGNQNNEFSGWADYALTPAGERQARQAGKLLGQTHLRINLAFTSVLKRAIKTTWLILEELDLMSIPITKSWRLNERHYGFLQGLNKTDATAQYGRKVAEWRRTYRSVPPPIDADMPGHPAHDIKYPNLDRRLLPVGESMEQTVDRFRPLWEDSIAPALLQHEAVMVVAHGGSLRALAKVVDPSITEESVMKLNPVTGEPHILTFDDALNLVGPGLKHKKDLVERRIDKELEEGQDDAKDGD